MNIDIDIVIFIGFLIVNLVIGLAHSGKIKTIGEYALGGRNFTTTALVSTIVATWVSGSMFFIDLSNTYSDGLYYLIPSVCMSLSLVITAYFLIPRMGEFLGNLSVAEAMGSIYGKEVRLLTAICGILGTIGGIAVQFKVFGNIFNYFLGIDPTYSIFLASSIVILYSSLGGIKAVTYTDIMQFVTFGFVIPLIGIILWNHIGNTNISFSATNDPNFDYKKVLDFTSIKFWEMIPLILYFAMPTIDSMDFQRISMGRNIIQVKKAWLIAAGLLIVVTLLLAWIPFLVKNIDPNLQADQVVNYVAANFTSTGLKGLVIIGIASMAMSTADSRINAASVLFANDIGKVFDIKINELILSKLFSLTLGIFAIYLALSKTDLLKMVMSSAGFYMAAVTVPLLLAIFGFRSTKKPVLIAMTAGFFVVLVGNCFEIDADVIIIGMAVNLVTFVGSHYLLKQPGGWIGIKDREYLDYTKKTRKRKRTAFLNSIWNFNLIKFCKKTAPKNELNYMYLGIYFIMYGFTTMYSTQTALLKEEGGVILTIYQIMMVTGVITAMYPIWPPRIKYEIIMQLAWNVIIFYMLIFFSSFFVMVSNFGQLQFAVFALNILIVTILTGWKLGISMVMVGFYLSSMFYKSYAEIESLDFTIGSPQFIFVYTVLFAGAALLIFFKPRQEMQELVEEQNQHLSGRVGT